MSISSTIIADSLNSCGNRLTTFILEMPRYVLAEINTHRTFSKNAASSRAIPVEKMIQQVIDNPVIPIKFGKNQPGMKANEELDDTIKNNYFVTEKKYDDLELVDYCEGLFFNVYGITQKEHAKRVWLEARDQAVDKVRLLNNIGLHKEIANRILEPWFHIKIILSGTDFENFFALRAHDDATPDLRALAYKMLEEYNKSTPKLLNEGEWHIPFGDKIDEERLSGLLMKIDKKFEWDQPDEDHILQNYKLMISAARCARISYLNFEGKDDYEADIKLCEKLFSNIPRHLSPAEHCAMALDKPERIGNFIGFKQFRKFFIDENLKDNRVIKK